MILLHHPAVNQFIKAFCWTLVHSLWQGLVVAIFAGILLMSTKKGKPSLRYNLLALLLVIFIAGAGLTFWYYVDISGEESGHATVAPRAVQPAIEPTIWSSRPTAQIWSRPVLTAFFDANARWIVGVWLLIFLFKFSQAIGGLVRIKLLRTRGVYPVAEKWQWHLRQLAQKMDMYERIALVASERINVPLVIGYFSPVIVVPVGFLTHLPLTQVEAILLHELAHIKRQDYLVNLLQSFVETLFFFNPALLWLSFLIREEREHCCDDLAISVLKDKSSLVNALVSFQEYRLADTSYAMAFAGKKNHLLDRIKRIIYKNNKQLNAMEKMFVAARCFMIIGLSVTISVSASKVVALKAPSKPMVVQAAARPVDEQPTLIKARIVHSVKADTLPVLAPIHLESGEGVSNMQFTRDGRRYEIVTDNGEVVYFKLDGKQVPKEEIGKYKQEIEQFSAEIKASRLQAEQARKDAEIMREKAAEQRVHADELRLEADKMRKVAEEFRYNANKARTENFNYSRNTEKLREEANELREHAELSRIHADEIRKQAALMKVDQKIHALELREIREKAEKMRGEADAMRIEAGKMRAQAEVHRKEAEVMREKAEKMRKEYEKLQEGLITDLIDTGVVSSRDGLSYKLDKNELIVNGQKQSDALHKKMKAKYLKSDDVQMVYNWQGRTGYTTTGMIYSK